MLVKDITPEFESRGASAVQDVKNEKLKALSSSLPTLEHGKKPVNSRAGFEEVKTFRRRVGD